jgi:hypothetical protein
MAILFGVLWLIASIVMGLFIKGDIFKNKQYFKIGLTLIILSFVCGFTMLLTILINS